jgi:transcriptional antiterminator RfaH
MPFLPLEPFFAPINLFESSFLPDQRGGRWWVLRTRPRAEKALARHLLERGLNFFLPQYQKRSCSNGRSFDSYQPLFPGYMFLHGDTDDRLCTLATNKVAQVIYVEDQTQIFADLSRIHHIITVNATLAPEDRLEPGMPVEIVGGPLKGLTGKIVTRHKKMRFLVEVRFLQQGASVDVESWMIQPVTGALVNA